MAMPIMRKLWKPKHSAQPTQCLVFAKYPTYYNKNGKLGDIAPTILTLMGIDIPQEMTGQTLL